MKSKFNVDDHVVINTNGNIKQIDGTTGYVLANKTRLIPGIGYCATVSTNNAYGKNKFLYKAIELPEHQLEHILYE